MLCYAPKQTTNGGFPWIFIKGGDSCEVMPLNWFGKRRQNKFEEHFVVPRYILKQYSIWQNKNKRTTRQDTSEHTKS